MDDRHVKVSDLRTSDKTADIYELVIEEHVIELKPTKYKLANVPVIKPNDYFITSGDAVQKTKALIRDYKEAIDALQQLILNIDVGAYLNDIKVQYSRAQEMLELLLKARGSNIFLETEWNQHKLYIIPKNPRAR